MKRETDFIRFNALIVPETPKIETLNSKAVSVIEVNATERS
jgi:hypothetical protein